MITTKFDYAAPETLAIAVKLLAENKDAQILPSISLLTEIKLGQIAPSLLVDLKKIAGLKGINGNIIGGTTTYNEIISNKEFNKTYHALVQASSMIGDVQLRNVQTVGDVFAYKDLACDLLPVAVALEASFTITGVTGQRTIPAEQFVSSSLQPGDIVVAINLPNLPPFTLSAYQSFKHPASGYTLCGVAAVVTKTPDGTISKIQVALTGAYTQTVRLTEVEQNLLGKTATIENIATAAKLAKIGTANISQADPVMWELMERYATQEYRNHIATVLTERAIKTAEAT